MAYLNAFDSTGRSSAFTTAALMMRLDTLSTKADSIAKRSKVLARAVSDSLGNFNLRIAVTDSVLIYASWDDEDDTFPEAHMTMSGRTSRAFVLDMAHGGCTPDPT
jgi:seryl-tRNA(Sec) selenium transferase